ncbi:MAG: dNTP triphosphohydrolase, partial [Atopobium sp.]|nr:dNTP triphosphohydrolase [Atopobium sp.]
MLSIRREDLEAREHQILSPEAAFSDQSKGRAVAEEPDQYRTCYQCDRDRILHSKSFRRLAHKTQVFLAPEGDHYRTRLIHTLEVSQIARSIARPLGLNEDLTEAIALGHDLGHTPFGHIGEKALSHAISLYRGRDPEASENERIFAHNQQSARIVEYLEKDGQGLNLSHEVIDGIR